MRRKPIPILLAVLWLLAPSSIVSAIELGVNSVLDQIDDDPNDGICHTAAGTCTLRAAVMTVNRILGTAPINIRLPAGIFPITRPPTGANDEGVGDLNFTPVSGSPTVSLIGAGESVTILDAGLLDRILRVHADVTLVVRDLTIRAGTMIVAGDGGGCVRVDGVASFEHVTIYDCFGASGGAVLSTGDTVEFEDSTVRDSVALVEGGGVWAAVDLGLERTTVHDNSADTGGGVYLPATGRLYSEFSTIRDNAATYQGGGLWSAGDVQFAEGTIAGNEAESGGGLTIDGGQARVSQSTIADNATVSWGGGIEVRGGVLEISQSAVHGNLAGTDGGGILTVSAGDLKLVNSTVSANRAQDDAGGLAVFNGGTANVYSSTIAFNRADSDLDGSGEGGGIQNDGAVVNLRNTLVGGNVVQDPLSPDDCVGTVGSYGRNLFGDVAGCSVVTGSGSWGLINDIALLEVLRFNGGPTRTHALRPGSNAIDGGDPQLGCLGPAGPLISDQRGWFRSSGVRCDVGAFEYGSLIFMDGFATGDLAAWAP